jgi:hypothetical protein
MNDSANAPTVERPLLQMKIDDLPDPASTVTAAPAGDADTGNDDDVDTGAGDAGDTGEGGDGAAAETGDEGDGRDDG